MFELFPGLFGIQFYMAKQAVLKVNRSEQNIFQHL